MAIGDWFNPPEVQAIATAGYRGRAGGVIKVRAIDDVEVVSVTVFISSSNGKEIERGEALLKRKTWYYTAKETLPRGKTVTIKARALDRPRHSGELEQIWPAET